MKERRPIIIEARRESSWAPLIIGLVLLAVAGGGFVLYRYMPQEPAKWLETEVAPIEPSRPKEPPPPEPASVAVETPRQVEAPIPPPAEPEVAKGPAPEPPAPAPQTALAPEAPPAEEGPIADARRALAAGDAGAALALVQPLAAEGIAAAQALLGLLHERGAGLAADPAQAFQLYTKAAAQGDPDGQFHLGRAWRDGIGTKPDQVKALAWLMHAGARGQKEAAGERDRLFEALDNTARVQADSMTRSLPVPMPAGWIVDESHRLRVWSPSWYRNGTFKVRIDGAGADGLVEGPGRVILQATLYGRSDRTFEGAFRRGLLLDERLRSMPDLAFELLETDEMRLPLDAAASGQPALQHLWRQTGLKSMEIEACPRVTARLFAVMAPDFSGVTDEEVKAVAIAAAQVLDAFCRFSPQDSARVVLLPPDHRQVWERGETTYTPKHADVQLYGFDQKDWSVSMTNFARQAHEQREREAAQRRQREERDAKRAREVAAASARPMPEIRGMKLGIGFEEFKALVAGEAVSWEPKLKEDFRLPQFNTWEQKVTIADGSSFTGLFASTQNGSQMMALTYEQHLREGPEAAALREQLYAKYGAPDEETGGQTWLTWWLKSAADGEPRGAFLKGRLETDRNGRVLRLRLTVNDYNLVRRDEREAAEARRRAEREAFEKKRSNEVKF
jgi:hypothetical protein